MQNTDLRPRGAYRVSTITPRVAAVGQTGGILLTEATAPLGSGFLTSSHRCTPTLLSGVMRSMSLPRCPLPL